MTTDLNTLREALENSSNIVFVDPAKAHLREQALAALSRIEAAAAAEYERGRQDGMKQEHALWKLARLGQEIEAAADQKTGETNAQLDHDSNAAQPEQQRRLAGAVALGQSVGGGSDAGTGHPRAEGTQHVAAVPELSQEDVVRLAREAGINADIGLTDKSGKYHPKKSALGKSVPVEWLERFASLVRSNCPEIPDSSPAAPQPGDAHGKS